LIAIHPLQVNMKIDPRLIKQSVYTASGIAIGGALLILIWRIDAVSSALSTVIRVFMPVIFGLVFAYIMDPLANFFECRVFTGFKKDISHMNRKIGVGKLHNLAVVCTVVLTLALIIGFFWLALPQLVGSLLGLADKLSVLPVYFENIQQWIGETFGFSSAIYSVAENPLDQLGLYLEDLWTAISPNVMQLLSTVSGGAVDAFSGLFNVITGFVIAVNLLLAKHMLLMQSRKTIFAISGQRTAQAMFGVLGRAHVIFRKYMIGIILDAALVGSICFLGCTVIGVQFALLIALIVAVTNFIPFFGPMIGLATGALIVLIDDPIKALWFVIFLVLLQQLDGNLFVPLIQGGATGVPSVWVLAAIITGAGFFGLVGVIMAVPVFACVYVLFKEYVEYRLRKRGLPADSRSYEEKADVDSYVDTSAPHGFAQTLADLDEKKPGAAENQTPLSNFFGRFKGRKAAQQGGGVLADLPAKPKSESKPKTPSKQEAEQNAELRAITEKPAVKVKVQVKKVKKSKTKKK
jgi:predicted PurR-regulated permease PerM